MEAGLELLGLLVLYQGCSKKIDLLREGIDLKLLGVS